MNTFSIKDLFKKAYTTIMKRKALYFSVTFVVGIVVIMLDKISQSHSVLISLFGVLVLTLLHFLIAVGSIHFILKDLKGESVTYNDFLPSNQILIRYLKTLLRFILKLLPMILLIIGAIVGGAGSILAGSGVVGVLSGIVLVCASVCILCLVIKYYFFGYVTVEENISAKDAIKKAGDISKENRWKLFWLMVVVGLLNLLGGVTLIGWIFTMPFSMIVVGYAYMALKNTPTENIPTEHTPKVEIVESELVDTNTTSENVQ